MATYIRQLGESSTTLLLEAGPLSGGETRQDSLKFETAASILADLKFDAVLWTAQDSKLGAGALLSALRMTPDAVVNSHLDQEQYGTATKLSKKGFAIFGLSRYPNGLSIPGRPAPVQNPDLVLDEGGKESIALTDYSQFEARQLAKRFPKLKLVVYRVAGGAPPPEVVGDTLLISPGSDGRSVFRVDFADGKMRSKGEIRLEAQFKDDPSANRLYQIYLNRVKREGLLDKIPRNSSEKFVGSDRCTKCHVEAAKIHKKSQHMTAFSTLEHEKHDSDPDCVSCHVTGFGSTAGYWNKAKTLQLAQVGCESCHGPGARHLLNPNKFKTPRNAKAACVSCHTPENSPGFDFLTYWPKIRHK